MRWLNRWFSFSWKKFVLVLALVPIMWFCHSTEYPRVSAFIRDTLQFLNDSSKVEKSLVTANINGNKDTFERPLELETITSVVNKLISYNPKNIVLCFSVRDFLNDDLKKDIYKFLLDKKNIHLQGDYNFTEDNLWKNDIFKRYPRFLHFSSASDSTSGPRDKKPRRMVLNFDKQGLANEYDVVSTLGYAAKEPSFFKYSFRLWETDQIFFKSYQSGTFGSFDARDVLEDKIDKGQFENKTILLGVFDEYSFSALPSVFNFSNKITGDNFKEFYFPHTDNMANQLNTLITGDYIKVPRAFNDLLFTFLILSILIFSNIPARSKIYLSISIIPAFLLLITLTYIYSSFYFDFSRSIVMIFFLQYLGIPIMMLTMFKEQETKKLQEINDARIDALLTVSEKVAHDIRSPLSAINLVAERATFPDKEYKEIFDGAVRRIDETASKILTRHRTKTGLENELTEQINVKEIIEDIVQEKRILNSKIHIEIDYRTINFDAVALKLDVERIFSNILDNSIYALKDSLSPRIRINIEENDSMINIRISDNGIGIPDQVLKVIGLARISTKSESNQGNGIGLLHAKRVIERLNGKFEITSQQNQGTSISISLPKLTPRS